METQGQILSRLLLLSIYLLSAHCLPASQTLNPPTAVRAPRATRSLAVAPTHKLPAKPVAAKVPSQPKAKPVPGGKKAKQPAPKSPSSSSSGVTLGGSGGKGKGGSGLTFAPGGGKPTAVPPSSGGNLTAVVAAAQKAVKVLSAIPALKNYAALLNTIFDVYSSGLLDQTTFFVPVRPDSLYRTFTGNLTKSQQIALASYHIVTTYHTWISLQWLPPSEQLPTAEGSSILKEGRRGGFFVKLSDNSTIESPALLVVPNLYTNSKPDFVVHGISRILVPQDLYS